MLAAPDATFFIEMAAFWNCRGRSPLPVIWTAALASGLPDGMGIPGVHDVRIQLLTYAVFRAFLTFAQTLTTVRSSVLYCRGCVVPAPGSLPVMRSRMALFVYLSSTVTVSVP